jgi:hypothetical protein
MPVCSCWLPWDWRPIRGFWLLAILCDPAVLSSLLEGTFVEATVLLQVWLDLYSSPTWRWAFDATLSQLVLSRPAFEAPRSTPSSLSPSAGGRIPRIWLFCRLSKQYSRCSKNWHHDGSSVDLKGPWRCLVTWAVCMWAYSYHAVITPAVYHKSKRAMFVCCLIVSCVGSVCTKTTDKSIFGMVKCWISRSSETPL